MLAMVVNDNACFQNSRGIQETIASKLAPTVSASFCRFQIRIISRTFAVNRSKVNGLVIICMPGSRNPPRTAACSA